MHRKGSESEGRVTLSARQFCLDLAIEFCDFPCQRATQTNPLDFTVCVAEFSFRPVLGSVAFPTVMLIFPPGMLRCYTEMLGEASYVAIHAENPVCCVMFSRVWLHRKIIRRSKSVNTFVWVLVWGAKGRRRC